MTDSPEIVRAPTHGTHLGSGAWLLCPAVARELERLDPLLARQARRGGPAEVAARPESVMRGGKRLRAALVLLAGTFGPRREGLRDAALVPELLHTGSLIQDDIMDRATTRRGETALYRRVGPQVASLFATHLYCASFRIVAGLPVDARARAVRAARDLCRGQALELACQDRPRVTAADYLRVVRGKTAALFTVAAWLGARIAGAEPAHRRALERFGHRFGVLYQLVDDLLDLFGDETELGKPVGADLERRVLTLPVVYWLEQRPDHPLARRLAAGRALDPSETAVLANELQASGALTRVLDDVSRYRHRALGWLSRLPAGPARDSLTCLLEALAATPARLGRPRAVPGGGPRPAVGAGEDPDRPALAGRIGSPVGPWPRFRERLLRSLPWLDERLRRGQQRLDPRLAAALRRKERSASVAEGLTAIAPALFGGAADRPIEATLALRLLFAAERGQRELRGDGTGCAAPILSADLLLCEFMGCLARLPRPLATRLAAGAESHAAAAVAGDGPRDVRTSAARRRLGLTALRGCTTDSAAGDYVVRQVEALLEAAERLECPGVRAHHETSAAFSRSLEEDVARLASATRDTAAGLTELAIGDRSGSLERDAII